MSKAVYLLKMTIYASLLLLVFLLVTFPFFLLTRYVLFGIESSEDLVGRAVLGIPLALVVGIGARIFSEELL